jgi:hypothetical protein
MHPRFLWILVLGAVVAAVAVGGFALERTGVIGSGESPTPPAQEQFGDNVLEESGFGDELRPDSHISPSGENEPGENEGGRGPEANENESDENAGGRTPAGNENEPDENDRGD